MDTGYVVSKPDMELLEETAFSGPAIPMPRNDARTWDGMLVDRASWVLLRDLVRKFTASETGMTEEDRALCSAWEAGHRDIWSC